MKKSVLTHILKRQPHREDVKKLLDELESEQTPQNTNPPQET